MLIYSAGYIGNRKKRRQQLDAETNISSRSPLSSRGRKIEISALNKEYDTGSRKTVALNNVSLDIGAGQFVSIVGPSGCGKTTLLNIIAGFEDATSGSCAIGGMQVRTPSHTVGFVFQRPALLPWKTVWNNIIIGPYCRHEDKNRYLARARDLLNTMGLEGFEHHYPHQLSGGMAQRVQLARVLINEPDVILMDEPFAAVDYQTRLSLQQLILRIWDMQSTTIVFITHDVDEAIFLGDAVYIMSRPPGKIIATIEPELPRPRGPRTLTEASFVSAKRYILQKLEF